jgi:hypothetical protein
MGAPSSGSTPKIGEGAVGRLRFKVKGESTALGDDAEAIIRSLGLRLPQQVSADRILRLKARGVRPLVDHLEAEMKHQPTTFSQPFERKNASPIAATERSNPVGAPSGTPEGTGSLKANEQWTSRRS